MTQPADTLDAADDVPTLGWDDAMALMNWKQGEHVTLIGPTGRGKTEAMIRLLRLRGYKVFITTKRIDETQDQMQGDGYLSTNDVAMINPRIGSKFIFRAKWRDLKNDNYRTKIVPQQRAAIEAVLLKCFNNGGWTVAVDELPYLTRQLKLDDILVLNWLQGRSAKVSLIVNTQRPRNVPLEAYSQASHLFIWNTPDSADIIRSGEMVALDRGIVSDVLRKCGKHDVLYVNVNDGDMCITNTRK